MTYLIFMIEQQRRKLHEIVNEFGMNSEQAIECSKELDWLLNQILKQDHNKKTNNED